MLSEADRNKAADILMEAHKTRKQAVQLSTTYPGITIEDAYAISTEVAKRRIAAGAKLIGHKVGLTSKAMQRSSQIDEPDYGHLLDSMMIADGAKVPHENYCRPRVEIELAFVLGKPLKGPGVGLPSPLSSRRSSDSGRPRRSWSAISPRSKAARSPPRLPVPWLRRSSRIVTRSMQPSNELHRNIRSSRSHEWTARCSVAPSVRCYTRRRRPGWRSPSGSSLHGSTVETRCDA